MTRRKRWSGGLIALILPLIRQFSGTKPLVDDAWSEQVIGRHATFVANGDSEFAGCPLITRRLWQLTAAPVPICRSFTVEARLDH
ncbi:hypothetical protein [Pseudorhodobacter sp.]|uniref:hypothetical protein n=1 Tax=Pseudorhodobacter sp. TaxID=1934400 RepID=UPI00264A130D|nr:hypothetical protein [Pseudorhodobacter sp.]MDN5787442.1 hypothetical protein [Pseudorhodobacter sp.]